MCFSPKVPDLPKKPEPESRESAAAKAEEETRRRLAGRTGRGGTVATTSLGDPNFATSAQRTVLGGSA